jgi:hypothetical protein
MEFNKNAKDMKTEVETFVIEETAELIYDSEKLERWNKIVSEIGLDGQNQIVKPLKSPIPFLYVKSNMKKAFETLCPIKTSVYEYDKTPIPLDILELVALSVREQYFQTIEIWYDDKSPDPFCIGKTEQYYGYIQGGNKSAIFNTRQEVLDADCPNVYTTNEKHYLLGKWADVKRSFDELLEMARMRYMKEQRTSYEGTIQTYERYLSELPKEADRLFS